MSYRRSTSVLYFCFANERAPLTMGPICQYEYYLFFLFVFTYLNTCFKNSYLELGVSKLSEQNFVGFTMKCTFCKNMKPIVWDIFLGELNGAR